MSFEFAATLDGDDRDPALDVTVTASVTPYADAIGCPSEYRSRFAGQLDVEILDVTDTATGLAVEVTDEENEYLVQRAIDQRDNARDAHAMWHAPEGSD